MPSLRIRWSEHEALKPYARPFGVTFLDEESAPAGSVAMSGSDLLYIRQFQLAVLALTGELFSDPGVAAAADPQRAWLDVIAAILPGANSFAAQPESAFVEPAGRVFIFEVTLPGGASCKVDAPALVEYQDFQAAVAHQTGVLYRHADVESRDQAGERQARWWEVLRECVARPTVDDAMTEQWPWR